MYPKILEACNRHGKWNQWPWLIAEEMLGHDSSKERQRGQWPWVALATEMFFLLLWHLKMTCFWYFWFWNHMPFREILHTVPIIGPMQRVICHVFAIDSCRCHTGPWSSSRKFLGAGTGGDQVQNYLCFGTDVQQMTAKNRKNNAKQNKTSNKMVFGSAQRFLLRFLDVICSPLSTFSLLLSLKGKNCQSLCHIDRQPVR